MNLSKVLTQKEIYHFLQHVKSYYEKAKNNKV